MIIQSFAKMIADGRARDIPDMHPVTAPVVRTIFNKVLEGERITAIARWLSQQGIASPSAERSREEGKPEVTSADGSGKVVKTLTAKTTPVSRWSDNTIRDMLRNEVYTRGIISRELYDQVQNRFADKSEITRRKRGLYQGLVRCGSCQRAMTYQGTDVNGRKKATYFCKFHTGSNISADGIHYSPAADFIAPEIEGAPGLKDIVENGILRVYRPDYHCWVYQVGNSLYWIVDQEFNFEDDGTTYIQYQLYTTQKDKLPQKRIENGWFWDNIGGNFEDYELQGDFGEYRVMKRKLPKEYSITSIVTGYYKNGDWIWKNYFRPIYDFSSYSPEEGADR